MKSTPTVRLARLSQHVTATALVPSSSTSPPVPLEQRPQVCRLYPNSPFGCSVAGVDLRRPLGFGAALQLAAALREHSVLVLRNQPLSDTEQLAFTREMAQALDTVLEPVHRVNGLQDVQSSEALADSRYLSKISNLSVDGKPIPPDDVRAIYNAGNQLWHSDSSFKRVSAMASCLAARSSMRNFAGGDTEFVSGRQALARLPPRLRVGERTLTRDDLRLLVGVHDLGFSRGLLVAQWGEERPWATELPPSRHPLVAPSPSSWSLETLFVGAHLSAIEGLGLSLEEGRELIKLLNTHTTQPPATQPDLTVRHRWRQHDLVIYDNTCCLHRGRPWVSTGDATRDMVRTTLMGKGDGALGYHDVARTPLPPPERAERLALLRAVGVEFRGGDDGAHYYAPVTADLRVPR